SRPWAIASVPPRTPTRSGGTGDGRASTGTRAGIWRSSGATARCARSAPSSPTLGCCRRRTVRQLAEDAVPVAHGAERLEVGVEPDQRAEQEDVVPRRAEEPVFDGQLGHLRTTLEEIVGARIEGRVALER